MLEDLPAEIRAALAAAQAEPRRGLREGPGLRLHCGERVLPILRLWDGGLSVAAEDARHLRGRVDVWDGKQHLFGALVVAMADSGAGGGAAPGEVICAFKRATPGSATPPRDYANPGADPEADP